MTKGARKCHTNFCRYTNEVLDGGLSSHITPAFSEEAAHEFFSVVYHFGPRNYAQPPWMSTPSPRDVEMDCSQFTANEITRVIKKMKSGSAPSPFDSVGYVIFKLLLSLFWSTSSTSVGPSPLFLTSGKLQQ